MKHPMASLKEAKDYLSGLSTALDTQLDEAHRRALDDLLISVDQFFNVAATINMQALDDHFINDSEATEIGAHGFILLLKLIDLMNKLDLPHKRKEIEQISLIFARWTIRYNGRIKHLEPIVNACAQLANILQDKEALKTLFNLMTEIADSCTEEIKQDLEAHNNMRPWRLLHINRGIVATRTHDPDIMKAAFNELLMYLPHEAGGFFAEGMKEMEALNYPAHVRTLMELYHLQKPGISLH